MSQLRAVAKEAKRRAAVAFLRAFDADTPRYMNKLARARQEAATAKQAARLAEALSGVPAPEDDPAASGVALRDSGSWAATVGLYS